MFQNTVQNTVENTVQNTVQNMFQNTVQNTVQNTFQNTVQKYGSKYVSKYSALLLPQQIYNRSILPEVVVCIPVNVGKLVTTSTVSHYHNILVM